ncbi:MAG: DUF3194 domain-containing protein [Candidatus Bathyarchaeota archaeon]|nr:DUF3194 domain-containing protein [Candidatus Bathyarchaeota archaeon]
MDIPVLTEDQMQRLSEIADEAARKHVSSEVNPRDITKLDVTVEAVGSKPVTVSVEVDLAVSPTLNKERAVSLADAATEEAFHAVEQYLSELSCQSKT